MLENAGWQEGGNFMLVFWTPERILMDECNANGTPYAAPATTTTSTPTPTTVPAACVTPSTPLSHSLSISLSLSPAPLPRLKYGHLLVHLLI